MKIVAIKYGTRLTKDLKPQRTHVMVVEADTVSKAQIPITISKRAFEELAEFRVQERETNDDFFFTFDNELREKY